MNDKRTFMKFPGEVDREMELFEGRPLAIIAAMLECFDSEGRQQFEIPEHVGIAFARRVREVMGDDHSKNSLDQAFGGRIARQRNALREWERRGNVVFYVIARCRELTREGKKGPFETAVAEAAAKFGLSEDNVREKYKAAHRR